MGWKIEIYRAFFVAFGAMELLSNLSYLLSVNGIQKSRKQHKELPQTVNDKNLKIKIVFMLLFGVAFLSAGLSSYILHQPMNVLNTSVLIIFAIYACMEALFYKYIRTTGFAVISIIFLLIYLGA